MGSSPLMSLGIRAMAANYAALQTTGHNIANANVEGYSRQSAVMSTSKGQFTGAGFFGKGVDVTLYDAFRGYEKNRLAVTFSMKNAIMAALANNKNLFKISLDPHPTLLGHTLIFKQVLRQYQ